MPGVLDLGKPVIAMIHTPPSPGLPGHPGMEEAVRRCRDDMATCLSAGADAVLIENMHDFPCLPEDEQGPEVAAYLSRIARELRAVSDLPLGIQVLFAATKTALAVAAANDLQFVRAEGWLYAHVSDKGTLDAQAGKLYRYRNEIGAAEISILTDIKKKHASHALTADLSVGDIAALLELHRSDAAVVTGAVTGLHVDVEHLKNARERCALPILIGSGITAGNLARFWDLADGFIVGTSIKRDGDWRRAVDADRLGALTAEARRLKG